MEKIKAIITTLFSCNKRMMFISASCIVVGFLASGIGFALVDYDIYKLNPDSDTVYTSMEKEIALKDINNIEIDVSYSDVILESIDEDAFQIQYIETEDKPMVIDTTSKTLSIKQHDKIKWFQFNWMNFIDKEVTVKVQIPKSYVGNLTIENGYGSIEIKDIKNLKDVSITNEHADIDIQSIEASNITLINAYGSIKANNLVSQNDFYIENDHDDVELRDLQANNFQARMAYSEIEIDTMSLQNKFLIRNEHADVSLENVQSKESTIDVAYGSVMMKDWLCDDTTIDVEHGDVTSDVLGKEADYHIISDIESGNSNLANERNEEKEKKFHVTLRYGNVNVNFQE